MGTMAGSLAVRASPIYALRQGLKGAETSLDGPWQFQQAVLRERGDIISHGTDTAITWNRTVLEQNY